MTAQLPPDEIAALPIRMMREFPEQFPAILELGNKKNSTGLYRDWYRVAMPDSVYICLDWNGEDGAVPLDMRYSLTAYDVVDSHAQMNHYPADEKLYRGFPLVTNFGFTEHVDNQMTCWSNVHEFVAPDGWLAICMPLMPEWKGHGLWMPTVEWYREFAKLNGYDIVFERIWPRQRPTFVATMRKRGGGLPFQMPVGKMEKSS